MTIRLRERPPPIHNFDIFPQEIVGTILNSFSYSGKEASLYLSTIASVCKLWNELLHPVTVTLLNNQKLNLSDVPYVINFKNTFQYLKLLQTKKLRFTFFNLAEITHLNDAKRKELIPLFSNVEILRQERCTFQDNAILDKFTKLKHLTISPNEYTDLSFILKLPELKTLALSFSASTIIRNAFGTIAKCTSISQLSLLNSIYQPQMFPDTLELPVQLEELTLSNFRITSHLFSPLSKIQQIFLYYASSILVDSFKNLENLKHLSIQGRARLQILSLEDLKVDSIYIESEHLRELRLNRCSWREITYDCPNLRKRTNTYYKNRKV